LSASTEVAALGTNRKKSPTGQNPAVSVRSWSGAANTSRFKHVEGRVRNVYVCRLLSAMAVTQPHTFEGQEARRHRPDPVSSAISYGSHTATHVRGSGSSSPSSRPEQSCATRSDANVSGGPGRHCGTEAHKTRENKAASLGTERHGSVTLGRRTQWPQLSFGSKWPSARACPASETSTTSSPP
jgi:hypothetical protein